MSGRWSLKWRETIAVGKGLRRSAVRKTLKFANIPQFPGSSGSCRAPVPARPCPSVLKALWVPRHPKKTLPISVIRPACIQIITNHYKSPSDK